ncbi:dentin sialophosphoprotein preproprotein-like protein [Burkholderia ambifaria IOP40-10]|uniref:Dentin sialophosphoprotein preproprotein-like protein n=1 Tax=Burkholderia ambifaria IOP40-10 TaxID=396596 RepID=B1FS01_9BURK|nr:dentin sialophosphoprotein preproprotein-like protein [Burkholderia ambifaria IOP40-10]
MPAIWRCASTWRSPSASAQAAAIRSVGRLSSSASGSSASQSSTSLIRPCLIASSRQRCASAYAVSTWPAAYAWRAASSVIPCASSHAAARPCRTLRSAARRSRSVSRTSGCSRHQSESSDAMNSGVSRASRASRSGAYASSSSAAHNDGCRRSAMLVRVRNAVSSADRFASSSSTSRSRVPSMRAASASTAWRGSAERAIAAIASCSPSGQPSTRSNSRAHASASTRCAKRAPTSAIVSSSVKRSHSGPASVHCPPASRSPAARSSPRRPATITRRFCGALCST